MRIVAVLIVCFLTLLTLHAQNSVRAQMDAERGNLSFSDKGTFEKARSFIQRDSTYYLGHYFMGGYLFYRANDKLGFTKAIEPLARALRLMEHDFDRQLRTRSNSYVVYSSVFNLQSDYGSIAYLLERCYQNVEMQDKAMEVLMKVRNYDFQIEQGLDSYNSMAWIFHRNRVYTSKQFSFLKNSVKANVAAADRYLDSALMKLNNDMPMNAGLFDARYLNRQYLSTYHYKAMIADYKLEIDSANHYYNELLLNGAYSSNNYAEFKLAMGDFKQADEFFQEAEQRDYSGEKTTKEYYYMRGTLDIYRAHPELADTLLNKVLQQQGSTPGYGWHCIGLARALHYEGLTDESQLRNNKAARFQELHIGTTWGQEQYNLAVASLNYINQVQFEQEYFFQNDEWWFWFNPVNWYKWVVFSLEKHETKLILASLISENPERNQVLYTIFSSENLMSFDEVWSVIDGVGIEYFIDWYKNLEKTDKRPYVKKYIRYFLGKLYLAKGDDGEAIKYFQRVLNEIDADDSYQGLLVARCCEGLALANSGQERAFWTERMYETYPQLLPFTNLKMKFNLKTTGNSQRADDILDDLKDCHIGDSDAKEIPTAFLTFNDSRGGVDVTYSVQAFSGKVLADGTLHIAKDELKEGGKILAYRLFKINKQKLGEKPAAEKTVIAGL
jgi:tetratricopeptide (TPR) repeat protein